MRRCRTRGAEAMYVTQLGDQAAAADHLYRSVGFLPIGHWRAWQRRDDGRPIRAVPPVPET